MSIHSQNDQVILEFGLHKPAFRIVVNSPTTHGSVGLSTGLDPAMTLGCGGFGGNITSDNISPRHLLNIKRVAYEITPTVSCWDRAAGVGPQRARWSESAVGPAKTPAPAGSAPRRFPPDRRLSRLARFAGASGSDWGRSGQNPGPTLALPKAADQAPLDFVCEEDVRLAIQAGRKLVVSERAIVTPAARDLGDANRVFTVAPWRG